MFSTNGSGTVGHPYATFYTFNKINSKWIVDLYVKHKTINLLEYNIGENLDVLGFVMNF